MGQQLFVDSLSALVRAITHPQLYGRESCWGQDSMSFPQCVPHGLRKSYIFELKNDIIGHA